MMPFPMTSPTVVAAGEGSAVWMFGDRYTVKLSGQETEGAFALVECVVTPRSATPPHVHHVEDETVYILSGTLTIWAGDTLTRAAAGACVHVPRGTAHMFKNQTDAEVKMLVMLAPAGFEQYLLAAGAPAAEEAAAPVIGCEAMERVIEMAQRYHMEVTAL